MLTVWFATLPTTALDGKSMTAKLYGKDCFSSIELTGLKAFEAGKAYSFSCTAGASTSDVEYVDLGLSVKWATCNLGASKPEDYGGYYQWAGLQDVTSTSISNANCPYHTGSSYSTGWTKYIPSAKPSYWFGNGSPDNKTVLDPEDDVVHVKLGGKWRMPTREEWDELMTNCARMWTTLNGVYGRKFTSKKNGNSIFLPATGCRYDDFVSDLGSYGYYWSSSLGTDSPYLAYIMRFSSDAMITTTNFRYCGQPIRPVSEY